MSRDSNNQQVDPGHKGDRLIKLAELLTIVPYSRQHIDRLWKAGTFPRPVKIGPARIAWWESEVYEWLRSRPRGASPEAAQPLAALNGRSEGSIRDRSLVRAT